MSHPARSPRGSGRRPAAKVSRRVQGTTSRLRTVVLGALLLLAVTLAVVLKSPLFAVAAVEVQGQRLLTAEEVVHVAAIDEGTSLFLVNSAAVSQRLRALPRVASVVVRRYWPHRVVLEIKERAGLLLIPCGEVWFEVATDGMVLAMHHSGQVAGLPLLEGLDAASIAVGMPLPGGQGRGIVTALASLAGVRGGLSRAALTPNGLEAYLADGTLLYLGTPTADLQGRLGVALEILAEMQSRGKAIQYIDVRVPGQPVVKPK